MFRSATSFPFLLFFASVTACAQWMVQDSHSDASFRGVDNAGNGVVWVSGTEGTILHTVDSGKTWRRCSTPPGAERLDFRGVQALDAKRAIVLSSGKGDESRLYQTTDGCRTWTLIATNTDPTGSWDSALLASQSSSADSGFLYILGDPVDGHFELLNLRLPLSAGMKVHRFSMDGTKAPKAHHGESVFAASNSAMSLGNVGAGLAFGTGGGSSSHWYKGDTRVGGEGFAWQESTIPIGSGGVSAGMFSVAFRSSVLKTHWWNVFTPLATVEHGVGVTVGGDFQKPDDGTASASYTTDGGEHWISPVHGAMPHGFRSAVAYDPTHNAWISVGPNGTDISTDNGHQWRPLRPGPSDQPDADKNWNALSLPFVVGLNGRIGILREDAEVKIP